MYAWQVLRTSSLFGESLRLVPKSSLKVLKTKNNSIVPKCAIGDSLVRQKKHFVICYCYFLKVKSGFREESLKTSLGNKIFFLFLALRGVIFNWSFKRNYLLINLFVVVGGILNQGNPR